MTGWSWRGDGKSLRWSFKVTTILWICEQNINCAGSVTQEHPPPYFKLALDFFHFRSVGVE